MNQLNYNSGRMKASSLFLAALVGSSFCLAGLQAVAQKQYMWCPDVVTSAPRAEKLRGAAVDLLIVDGRVQGSKTKSKCEFRDVANSIAALVQSAFPSATISHVLSTTQTSQEGRVFIEITVTGYHASFVSAKWTGTTTYSVSIKDMRLDHTKSNQHSVTGEKSAGNVGGMASGKKVLNLSFVEAGRELLDFISSSTE